MLSGAMIFCQLALLLQIALLSSADEATAPLADLPSLVQLGVKGHRSAPLRAGSTARPNIAVIQLDQWRFDWDGYHAPALQLPAIRRLGDGGTRFERAYVPSPICVPSRVCFASGMAYRDIWVTSNGQDYVAPGSSPTFMSQLQGAGYATMFAGKDHLSAEHGVGLDGSTDAAAMGIDRYRRTDDKYGVCTAQPMILMHPTRHAKEPYGVNLTGKGVFEEQCKAYGPFARGAACEPTQVCVGKFECGFRCDGLSDVDEALSIDAWTEASAEELLREHLSSPQGGKPWFLQLGFPGPHPPFILSPSMREGAEGREYPPPVDANFSGIPGAENVDAAASRRAYGALVEHIDEQIARFLGFLEESGELNDTVVVVMGDHGEHLGDHSEFAKASPWEPSVRVPLIVAGLGVAAGRVERRPVSTLDVVGAILELAGAERAPRMTARSLAPMFGEGGEAPREVVVSGLTSRVGALDPRENKAGLAADWEMALKRFNETATLKLVCCPNGCFKQGTMFPKRPGEAQLVLMSLLEESLGGGFERNVLDISTGVGVAEARELLQSLGDRFREACAPLLGP